MANFQFSIWNSRALRQLTVGVALGVALVFSIAVLVQAQSNIPQGPTDAQVEASGITFPVQELGGCADKQACKKYCEDPANIEACVAFAEKHGMMNKEEAAQAKKFSQAVAKGGPGGCKTPQECESFCGDIANLEACMSFAKQQGIKNNQVSQGEKLLTYMKSGGKMPGGCQSERECKGYCSDFSHAEECYEFAKNAGIMQTRGQSRPPDGQGRQGPRGPGSGEDLSPEQFEKVMELAKKGETPGGCTSKDACESYCGDASHFEECTAFAEKAGFMSQEEAARIRKTGGKGPGGCSSQRACDAFCNEPANRETCFKFAEENGFISKEEAQRIKEGFVQLRAGIEHAPPEVAACLKSAVGTNIIDDIQAGKLTPGPEIGERMRGCFEKFGERQGPQDMFKNAPPEVAACIKEKIGDKFEAIKIGKEMPTPEMADTLRVCFQSVQFERQFEGPGGEGEFRSGQEGQGRGPQGPRMGPPSSEVLQQFLRTAPQQVSTCLKEKLGDKIEAIQSGKEGFDHSIMRSCFESFRPESPPPGEGGFPGGPSGGVPDDVLVCAKEKASEQDIEKLRSGGARSPEMERILGECFGKMRPDRQFWGVPGDRGNRGEPPVGGFLQGSSQGPGQGFDPGGIPREILSCVKEKVGEEVSEEKLRTATGDQGNLGQAIRECFGKVQPSGQGEPQGGSGQGQLRGQPPLMGRGFPGNASGTGFPPPRPIAPPGESGRFEKQGPEGQGGFPEQFNQQFNQQYNAEFQKQYEEKYRQEYQQQMQGGFPGQLNQPGQGPSGGGLQGGALPTGGEQRFSPGPNQPHQQFQPNQPFLPNQPNSQFEPRSGQLPPQSGFSGQQPQGQFNQPFQLSQPFTPNQPSQQFDPGPQGGTPPSPSGGEQAPPPPPPPPSSAAPQRSLLGIILAPFLDVIGGK